MHSSLFFIFFISFFFPLLSSPFLFLFPSPPVSVSVSSLSVGGSSSVGPLPPVDPSYVFTISANRGLRTSLIDAATSTTFDNNFLPLDTFIDVIAGGTLIIQVDPTAGDTWMVANGTTKVTAGKRERTHRNQTQISNIQTHHIEQPTRIHTTSHHTHCTPRVDSHHPLFQSVPIPIPIPVPDGGVGSSSSYWVLGSLGTGYSLLTSSGRSLSHFHFHFHFHIFIFIRVEMNSRSVSISSSTVSRPPTVHRPPSTVHRSSFILHPSFCQGSDWLFCELNRSSIVSFPKSFLSFPLSAFAIDFTLVRVPSPLLIASVLVLDFPFDLIFSVSVSVLTSLFMLLYHLVCGGMIWYMVWGGMNIIV